MEYPYDSDSSDSSAFRVRRGYTFCDSAGESDHTHAMIWLAALAALHQYKCWEPSLLLRFICEYWNRLFLPETVSHLSEARYISLRIF
jgi:hypothetical protein